MRWSKKIESGSKKGLDRDGYSKEPRDGFALESQVSDLFVHEGVKVITIHDLTILLVGQASVFGEVDRLVLVAPKCHVDNLG